MDTRQLAKQLAPDLFSHRNKLAGKAEDAVRAQFSLHRTAGTLDEHRDAHAKAAENVLSHWKGEGERGFERQSDRLDRQLKVTGSAGRQAERVVSEVSAALSGGHTAAQRLIDEYLTKATRLLDAGFAVSGAGSPAALQKAVAGVADLVPHYTKESVTNLRRVHREMEEAAKKLRALEKEIEHDGIHDPGHERATKPADAEHQGNGKARTIISAARKELGTRENPPGSNRNPYGPTAAWCSSFATAMWRKAGVKIPILPFTGDVYRWGQEHGKAYGRNQLDKAKPGDVLLFGTGPGSPSTSTHIGIVEKVDGNTVTLIEGNSGDQVRRNTHKLSPATFYGGVHP
ncbi:CHAP domain-containing protein [Amycolatopsis magusensis]|uniref:CHAP domain-containing protein n=1 Tax=Amycolatopsis magusensis TaxID=882444 RepID=UPI0024A8F28F|nr:CHAP domain-containing protein [Amycolatopsis magusensis]MDI5975547.1 CHAP domain-containing protein [Amycolatopsis magusensis]